MADHMQKVLKPNFAAAWEEIGESNELEDTYSLSSMNSVEGEFIITVYTPCQRQNTLQYSVHNFIRYWPICKILSLLQSAGNA